MYIADCKKNYGEIKIAPAFKNLRLIKAILESPYSNFPSFAQLLINWKNPAYLQIESTTRCTNNCMFCLRDATENFDIEMNLFNSIINQLHYSRFGIKHIDLTGLGEPLLNSNIALMIKLIKQKGFRTGFTTNFCHLDKSIAESLIRAGIDYLYVSFDGATKETFEKIRIGSSFERTQSSIRAFLKTKSDMGVNRPHLRMSVILAKHNLGEITDLVKLAEDLCMDSISFNLPCGEGYTNPEVSELSFWERLTKGKSSIARLGITLKKPRPCVALKGCYITYNGWVLPCNSMFQILPRKKLTQYIIGDVKRQSIHQIWTSNKYRRFRTLLALGKRPSYCSYCPRPYQI